MPGAWSARRRHVAAAGPGAVPLLLRPQGGRALLADRGHTVVALGSPPVRERGCARSLTRRRRGDVELHRGDEPRLAADRVGRAAAQQPSAARGPWAADGWGPWGRQDPRRVSAQPELARWVAAWDRTVRP